MGVSTEQSARLGSAEEIRISSYRPDGTLRPSTPIWIVQVGSTLYVRSAFGGEGAWFRHAMKDRRAHIQAAGITVDVSLEPVSDAAENARVDAAYRAKYHAQPSSLSSMLAPSAAGSTVRLS